MMDNFRAGTSMNLMAIIGSTAGNRFLITCPAIKNVAMDPTDRGGLIAAGMNFQADGADSSFYVCAF
jgi:hypothetical protein